MKVKENINLAKVSKDDQGVVNPTYASAIRDIEKAEEKKEETTKVQETPKHDENPKNPKMVKGAKKMHLDESLFEDLLVETGEWEDDEEGLLWKQQLLDLVHQYTTFDSLELEDVEGFDKYQGPYVYDSGLEFWLDNENEDCLLMQDLNYNLMSDSNWYRICSREDFDKFEQGNLEPLQESLKEAKNPKFVGQFARKQTDDEINRFVDVFKKVLANNGFDTSNIIVDRTGNDEKPGYFGVSAVVVKCPVSGLDSKRRNRQGDTVWGINNIIMRCYAEDGYSDYDNHLPQLQDRKGYGNDPFDAKQYNIYLSTDGKIKPYKRQYKYTYTLEGDNHYHYDDTIEEFENDIDSYLKGLKRTIGLSEKLMDKEIKHCSRLSKGALKESTSANTMTKEQVLQNAETIFNQLQDTNNILISGWRPFDTLEAFGYAHKIRKGNDSHSGEEILWWENYGSSAEDNTLEDFEWLIEKIFNEDKYFLVLPVKDFYAKLEEFYDQERAKRQAELDGINEARVGKTKEVKVLQGNYGYGWDDLIEYDIADFNGDLLAMNREIKQDLKDYRENETDAPHRVITRRVARELEEDKELDKEVSAIRRDMTKVGMPPKKSREEHKKFLSKLKDKRKEIKESAEPDVAGFVQEIKQVLKPEDIDTYESDLYVRVSPEARRLLRKYNMLNNPLLSTFVDEIDHDRWYDIPFGNLDNQLSLIESKQLNEGAGAGYTVQGELYEIKINHIEDIEVHQDKSAFGTDLEFAKVKVDADARFDGTVESYYYGAELEGAQVKITEFDINPNILHYLGLEEFNYGEITAEDLESQFGSIKFKSDVIGGGWVHTPFNGNVTASRVDDDYSPFVDGVKFHFVNQEDIDYAEQGLQGELDDDYSEDDSDLEESTSLKEMSRYGMQTQFDKRKSFYNKADVDVDDETGEKTLYSYNTPVAKITKDKKVTLLPKWDLSATTLRHVKEFLKQNGLVADSLEQIRRDYI